ncbi:MAG: hypothetical protein PXX77_03970 [Gallionella sp.]|nr:hypothetical protein [Gallionella sp.]
MSRLQMPFCILSKFLLIALVWSSNLQAQTTTQESPSHETSCRISLPYKVGQFPDCTPQSAAAYDFAFCAIANIAAAKFAPETDKSLGENSKSAVLMRDAAAYLKISEGLTDTDTLKHNVELVKNFYSSLQGKDDGDIQMSINYVKQKCHNVYAWHRQPVDELVQKLKSKPINSNQQKGSVQ